MMAHFQYSKTIKNYLSPLNKTYNYALTVALFTACFFAAVLVASTFNGQTATALVKPFIENLWLLPILLFLAACYSSILSSEYEQIEDNNHFLWTHLSVKFTQRDVDLLLRAAYDAFYEASEARAEIYKARPKQYQAQSGAEASTWQEVCAERESEVQRQVDHFWFLHGFFKSLDFEVQGKISDYHPDFHTKEHEAA